MPLAKLYVHGKHVFVCMYNIPCFSFYSDKNTCTILKHYNTIYNYGCQLIKIILLKSLFLLFLKVNLKITCVEILNKNCYHL